MKIKVNGKEIEVDYKYITYDQAVLLSGRKFVIQPVVSYTTRAGETHSFLPGYMVEAKEGMEFKVGEQ